MNIALCTDSYLPTMGGTEYVVDILARKLVSDKFGKNRVAVFTQNFCRKNDKDPIFPYEIYRTQSVKVPILGEYVSYPKMDIKFTKDFVDFKPDIVHVHTLNEIGSWAVGLAKSLNVKSILTIHTRYYYAFDIFVPFAEDSFLHKSIVDTFMKKLVDTAENADVLTTVSESSLKDELIDIVFPIKKPPAACAVSGFWYAFFIRQSSFAPAFFAASKYTGEWSIRCLPRTRPFPAGFPALPDGQCNT